MRGICPATVAVGVYKANTILLGVLRCDCTLMHRDALSMWLKASMAGICPIAGRAFRLSRNKKLAKKIIYRCVSIRPRALIPNKFGTINGALIFLHVLIDLISLTGSLSNCN